MRCLLLAAFIDLCFIHTATIADSWTVEGLYTNFTLEPSAGWVGGNYYQMAERMDSPVLGKPRVIQLFGALRETAKDLDALIFYILEPGELVPCIIRVIPAAPAKGATADTFSKAWARGFAQSLQQRGPPGSTAKLVSYKGAPTHRVGGFPAVRLAVRLTRPDGGRIIQVNDMVVLGNKIQMFVLRCDERLSSARISEYGAMLGTVKYH